MKCNQSRIWTRVAVSNSCDDNHYTTGTFAHSFRFVQWSARTVKSTILQFSFLLLFIIRSGLLAKIRFSVYLSMSHRSLSVSFSRTDAWLCVYHLAVWWNLNFWHIYQWITLPTSSYIILYSFSANLLLSLIMLRLIYSLVKMIGSYGVVFGRDSVSLLKFPFLSHNQVFSCEMLFISRLKHP